MNRLLLVLCSSLLVVFATASRPALALATDSSASASPSAPVLTVRRFALVVGANDGGVERVVLRYAGTDAAAVSSVLQRFGGVAPGDMAMLNDPSPSQLDEALDQMEERIAAARRGGQHIQFVFYYSGHSDEEGLLLAGQRMSYKDLRHRVQQISADVRIAVLDSCASGAFTRTKGGTKRAPFLVSTAAEVKGHAFLTSSSVDEAAQESDRVGGSFFTHYFTTGLRGAADVDGDRLITLSEAYQFAFDETLARTEATHGGAQHAAYDIQLAGSGDLVMTDLRETTARLELSEEVGGRISVRNAAGQLSAELYKPPGSGAVDLALEPGRYQISVDDGQELLRADLAVADGRVAVLERSALRTVDRESTVKRGGPDEPLSEDELDTIPLNIGLLPPLSVNGQHRGKNEIRNVFSMAGLWSDVYRLDGIAMALGASVVRERMNGAQLSVGGNIAGRVDGLQLANGFNHAKAVSGVQAAIVNSAKIVEPGFQGGVVNVVGKMRGTQLGIVNVGGDVTGAQVGIFNFANRADAAVGLVSITREGNVHPEVSINDTASINLALRFPATYTYSFIEAGLHPGGEGRGWQLGFGFGGHIPVAKQLFVDVDIAGHAVFRGLSDVDTPDGLAKLRAMFGWQAFPRLAVFGGPTLNVLVERNVETLLSRPGLYQWGPHAYRDSAEQLRVRVWPGFVAGVRF